MDAAAPPPPSSADLDYPSSTELAAIADIHAAVAKELPDWPDAYAEELRHDVHVCRFLRGNQRDVARAAERLAACVKYRTEFNARPEVKAMRAAMGDDCTELNRARQALSHTLALPSLALPSRAALTPSLLPVAARRAQSPRCRTAPRCCAACRTARWRAAAPRATCRSRWL